MDYSYSLDKLKPHEEWQYNVYIFKLHLEKVNNNDIIVFNSNNYYHDFNDVYNHINNDIIFPIEHPTLFLNKTSADIMTILGENNEYYKEGYILNTDIIIVKKTDDTVQFIYKL